MAITRADIHLLYRLLGCLKEYRLRLAAALLCSVFIAGLTALYAWLVRPFLDGIFIDKNRTLLLLLPIAILSITILKSLSSYAQVYLVTYVSNWLMADIREQLFVKLIRLPVAFHDSHSSGRLSSRVLADVPLMARAIPDMLKNFVQQVLTFLAMLAVLFSQDWKLTIALIGVGIAALFCSSRFGDRLRKLARRGQELTGDIAVYLKDAFSGIRILKIYTREDQEAVRFRKINHAIVQTAIKSGQVSAWVSPVTEMIGMTAVTAIMAYGGYQVVTGAMTPGAFSSFVAAIIMAFAPIRRLANVQNLIQSSLAGAERVFEILDLEHEGERHQDKATLPPLAYSIEFRRVSFRYIGCDEDALKEIDLTIQAGTVFALVGKTGSGKTTLANLLPGFYEPSGGAILIDKRDIRTVSLFSLRRQMAMVSQDAVLFDDTIRNNIAFGRSDAKEEDILHAAGAAYALEFIERLPNGMNTMIGENGVRLSGGQRQRLAIARAVLRNAPILILDEATSSLDSESEQMVQQGLENLMKGRTCLVIAHRLSTIHRADRIAVLDEGHVVGQGTHTLLLEHCEVYRRLYKTQFDDGLLAPS